VLPFSKNHDASDPVSYSVASGNKKVSFMTDIGVACNNVVKHVKDSNVLFMEANHDIEMLSNGRYPAYLKKRILSDNGHLSNYAAALCILEHATPKLKHIVLSHLSENNNTEEIALKTIKSLISNRKDLDLKIHLSSKHEPTELISI
jgi:phosphoribosyl 1,2-cyclic phosphodiesterase